MMKFFEWASFLLASVVSGGDVSALFDSAATLSAPKIVAEDQTVFMNKKSEPQTRDTTNSVKEEITKKKQVSVVEQGALGEEVKKASKPLEPGVTLHLPENSSLVAEEQVEIRIGDKFAAVIIDPVSGEIFSQSEWVEVTK